MTRTHLTFEFAPISAAAALLITAGLAYVLGRRLELWPAVLIAGLALPTAMIVLGAYYAASAPDDIPRWLLLTIGLCVAAVASPVTLGVSYLAASFGRG